MADHGPIESNPVYISLTYKERKEYEVFQKEVKDSFPENEDTGPQLAHLVSDIVGAASSGAASLGFSSILGLLSAVIALLFFLA